MKPIDAVPPPWGGVPLRGGALLRPLCTLALLLCFALPPPLPAADKDRSAERIENLAEKLGRRLFVYPDPTSEQLWLHETATALLERTKKAREDKWVFDRLARATDALLEASESILDARKEESHVNDEDDHEEAARGLEGDYFRVQQAEYFATKSSEPNADEYLKCARVLYQQARRAFDEQKYDTAETLGDAAGDVARALEYLAQAAIRVPEPPRLEP
jgi:hypothetical protein